MRPIQDGGPWVGRSRPAGLRVPRSGRPLPPFLLRVPPVLDMLVFMMLFMMLFML